MAAYGRGRGKDRADIESLERENDRGLDLMSERVGLLKAATFGIKNEVDSQNKLLDGITDSMSGSRGILASVNDKFKVVMSNKQNRNLTIFLMVGVSILLFWWLLKQK